MWDNQVVLLRNERDEWELPGGHCWSIEQAARSAPNHCDLRVG